MSIDSAGKLHGISVNSAAGVDVKDLSATIPNRRIGVALVERITAAGGTITPTPTPHNPYHCLLSGVTPAQAEALFSPTIPNPNVP